MTINLVKKNDIEYKAMNDKGNVVGAGFLNEFLASEVYEVDRVNYFIQAESAVKDTRITIVNELIAMAMKMKSTNYPLINGRIYHACFSKDKESIEFYNSIDGFENNESMNILTYNLSREPGNIPLLNNYKSTENSLRTDEEIKHFIDQHSKIFRRAPYDVKKIRNLQEIEGFKNISVFKNEVMIANILLHVEGTGVNKYGWVEDLFVDKEHRRLGIADYLMDKAHEHFKEIGFNESRLEVWSSNRRAMNLYTKIGYKLFEVPEVSIGMNIQV
ncbi:MAG: GNAT family N-acetyltransferase [Promethearchaeota archaeon]|jgi:ribosomal protein S18 acetylase RimI-like enzyme